MQQLYEILRGYPGNCSLQLVLSLADGTQVKCPCERPRVDIVPEMQSRVEELLGAENVRLVASPRANGSGSRATGYAKGR